MPQAAVLIVENESIIAADLASKVIHLGYRVLGPVSSGEQALRVAQGERPDLALIDIRLAGNLDGIDTAKQLRTSCDTAVIFVTAHSDKETLKKASAIGTFGFVLKPLDERDLGTQLDIALYKHRAERTLRQREERYRAFVANSTEGIWRIEFDPPLDISLPVETQIDQVYRSARLVECNDAMSRMYGLSKAEDLVGRDLGFMLPESDPMARQYLASVIQAGYRATNVESVERSVDGQPVYFLNSMVGIVENGYLVRMWGTQKDITDRKRVEQHVMEARQRYADVVNSIDGIVWEVDLRTRLFTFVSPQVERIFGYALSSWYGKNFWEEQIHPADRERVVTYGVNETRAMRDHVYEYRMLAKDGRTVWIRDVATVIVEQDHPKLLRGLWLDITSTKQAEEQISRLNADLRQMNEQLQSWNLDLEHQVAARTDELVQSQRRLRALAAELRRAESRERKRVATELHDHLAQMLVLARLKVAQAKKIPGPSAAELITETEAIINECLSYTRTLVAELSPPVLRDHGLAAGLRWLADYMKKYDMTVDVTALEEDASKVSEEQAELLFQSVRELLMNSWKHAGTGHATVTMARQSQWLRIEVQDRGKGFEPTAAVAPSAPSKFGLFSIQERMTVIGGSFEIHSVPGEGTRGVLIFPLSEVDSASAPPPVAGHPREGATPTTGPVRVILVDDHVMVRQGLRTILDGCPDVEVIGEAADGEDAVRLTHDLRPAVVIMDINMPKMNGIDATARITSAYPDIRVIGLSVNANAHNQDAMKQAGADLLLTKEAAVDELYRAIQSVLQPSSSQAPA